MSRLCNTTGNETGANGTCSNRSGGIPGGFMPPASLIEILRINSIVCYLLIVVLSILGNSAIITIVLQNKSMRSKANVLIINMAVSDLLATFLAVPRRLDVAISKSFKWKAPASIAEGACKLAPFMREVSCAVSIFSMVAIAVDRFYAIVIPLARRPRILEQKFLIPTTWIAAWVINGIYLYAFQLKKGPMGLQCMNVLTPDQDKMFDTFRFVIFMAIPLVSLLSLYLAIALKMSRQAIPGATSQSFATNRREQNKKIVKLAVTIVAFFFICWIPYYILLLIFLYSSWQFTTSQHTLNITFILQDIFDIVNYTSFAVNPIICMAFSSNFRRHTRRTFCRSHSPKSLNLTQRTTASNQTTSRTLSLHNLDVSLGQVTGIDNPAHKEDEAKQS